MIEFSDGAAAAAEQEVLLFRGSTAEGSLLE
jgi:hypothetical protein